MFGQIKNKTKKNKHNNEKTKLSEEVITIQRKDRLLELFSKIFACDQHPVKRKEI